MEASLGSKLDHVLVANGATLGSLEAELRQTLSDPVNRSMSGPMTQAYLALVLFRDSRPEEALDALLQSASGAGGFSIDAGSGVWMGAAAEGYHMHDAPLAAALARLLRGRGARSVLDLGCGLGLYVRDLRAAGLRAGGFDGNPATWELSAGRCQQLDLSREVDLGTAWDWALSLEVAEHIPPQFEQAFVRNLARHACHGMVLSWGNQAGEGHVNLKRRADVERLFGALGFFSDASAAEALRRAARLPWLQETVLVFVRRQPDPSCSAPTQQTQLPALFGSTAAGGGEVPD